MHCPSLPFRVFLPLEIIQQESPEFPVGLETARDKGSTEVLTGRKWVPGRTYKILDFF
jgi:hypothetical protein